MARRQRQTKPSNEELIKKLQQQFEEFKTAVEIKNKEVEEKQNQIENQTKEYNESKEQLINDIRGDIHTVQNELEKIQLKINTVTDELSTEINTRFDDFSSNFQQKLEQTNTATFERIQKGERLMEESKSSQNMEINIMKEKSHP